MQAHNAAVQDNSSTRTAQVAPEEKDDSREEGGTAEGGMKGRGGVGVGGEGKFLSSCLVYNGRPGGTQEEWKGGKGRVGTQSPDRGG